MRTIAPIADMEVETSQMVSMVAETFRQGLGRTNFFVLLAWGRLGIPSIGGIRQIDPTMDRLIEVSSYGELLGVQFGLLAVGLLIACFFLGMLGQVVRGQGIQLTKLAKRLPTYWLYLVVILFPLGILLFMAFAMTFVLGVLAFLGWILMFWLLLYLYFFPEAITMSEAKPLEALMSSFAVVRANFLSAAGLIILVNVIGLGLGLIWQQLMGSTVGTVVAILLNAYIGTSLTLACFIFYRDRLARWQEFLQEQRSRQPHV